MESMDCMSMPAEFCQNPPENDEFLKNLNETEERQLLCRTITLRSFHTKRKRVRKQKFEEQF